MMLTRIRSIADFDKALRTLLAEKGYLHLDRIKPGNYGYQPFRRCDELDPIEIAWKIEDGVGIHMKLEEIDGKTTCKKLYELFVEGCLDQFGQLKAAQLDKMRIAAHVAA